LADPGLLEGSALGFSILTATCLPSAFVSERTLPIKALAIAWLQQLSLFFWNIAINWV
jgi:hypothetical protein